MGGFLRDQSGGVDRPQRGPPADVVRITSYNVCYTKLLRLAFAGEDRTRGLNEALVADTRAAGARAVLASDDARLPALRLPSVERLARPVVELLPVEMLTLAIPALDGREAGTFRIGGKVTTTE